MLIGYACGNAGLLGKHDKPSLQALELIDFEIAEHNKFHEGERDVHDDAKLKSEREPHNQVLGPQLLK